MWLLKLDVTQDTANAPALKHHLLFLLLYKDAFECKPKLCKDWYWNPYNNLL